MTRDRFGVGKLYEPSTDVPGFVRPAVWPMTTPTGTVVDHGPAEPVADKARAGVRPPTSALTP